MVNISKKYLEENLKLEIWNKFLKSVNRVKSVKELIQVLEKNFTKSELVMLEKRLGIIYLLEKGFKYREIEEILDVMPTTISFLKKGFKNSVKIVKKNKKTKEFGVPGWMLKKNSKFPTSYSGKGRWRI